MNILEDNFQLFRSKKTLEIKRAKLEQDETLAARTKWSVDDVISLLEISIET